MIVSLGQSTTSQFWDTTQTYYKFGNAVSKWYNQRSFQLCKAAKPRGSAIQAHEKSGFRHSRPSVNSRSRLEDLSGNILILPARLYTWQFNGCVGVTAPSAPKISSKSQAVQGSAFPLGIMHLIDTTNTTAASSPAKNVSTTQAGNLRDMAILNDSNGISPRWLFRIDFVNYVPGSL